MNFKEIMKELKQNKSTPIVKPVVNDVPVLAEILISGGQLHGIATGKCMTVSSPGETMGIRFLLKNNFKAGKSNFIVKQFVMQVVALGKGNTMTKEDIATNVKMVKVEPKRKLNHVKTETIDNGSEVFDLD